MLVMLLGKMIVLRPIHTEKARESVPVARPTLRGLRIAQSDRTSNAEAHAVYVYTPIKAQCGLAYAMKAV